ncbi:MAG: molybdopterin-dependent oxidoreductase [Acidobacteria bacterium]|nr:molybdopterin-dependent oxidoreductase [Acidobacteriota bacterium]
MTSRRDILQWGVRAGALLALFGGQGGASLAQRRSSSPRLAGYELLDIVPFVGEGRKFVGIAEGEGASRRLALDTSTLTTQKLITPNEEFFVRTGYPKQLEERKDWHVAVQGLVHETRAFPLSELASMTEPLGVHLLECAGSTRSSYFGLMSAADWKGVPLARLLDKVASRPEATRVLVSGVDPGVDLGSGPGPEAGWIFTLEELALAGAALAFEMNGVPLAKDHGAPIRLIVPGWYGCVWIKWVDKIVLVDDASEATPQMLEYATRTQQVGVPRLARDFRPAMIEPSAMAVRVEKWSHDGSIFYRVVGILWGGDRLIPVLEIGLDPEPGLEPVEHFRHETNDTWTLWSHTWRPVKAGRYRIRLVIDEPDIRSWRMAVGYYDRSVEIDEV